MEIKIWVTKLSMIFLGGCLSTKLPQILRLPKISRTVRYSRTRSKQIRQIINPKTISKFKTTPKWDSKIRIWIRIIKSKSKTLTVATISLLLILNLKIISSLELEKFRTFSILTTQQMKVRTKAKVSCRIVTSQLTSMTQPSLRLKALRECRSRDSEVTTTWTTRSSWWTTRETSMILMVIL